MKLATKFTSCFAIMADELLQWMNSVFINQLDSDSFSLIFETLKANFFTTRMKLKLIQEDGLEMMFGRSLALGSKAVLKYQLQRLREESPLISKHKPGENHTTPSEAPKKKVVKALQLQEMKLKHQVQVQKQDISELKLNIESMEVNIPEAPPVGNGKSVCGHCHHRGHRNNVTNPCSLKKCTDFTYCGKKDKHPEYFSKLNSLKIELRKKEKAIKDLETQIQSMEQFSSSSEHQFIKNLAPRMYKADASYKLNKAKLMRDVRLLREHFDGEIPDDATDIKGLISKLKMKSKIVDESSESYAFAEDHDHISTLQISPVKAAETKLGSNKHTDELPPRKIDVTKLKSKCSDPQSSTDSSTTADSDSSSSDETSKRKRKRQKKKTKSKSHKKRSHKKRSHKNMRYVHDSNSSDDANTSNPRHPLTFTDPYMFPGYQQMNPFSYYPFYALPQFTCNTSTSTTSSNTATSVINTDRAQTPTKPEVSGVDNSVQFSRGSPTSPVQKEAVDALLALGKLK